MMKHLPCLLILILLLGCTNQPSIEEKLKIGKQDMTEKKYEEAIQVFTQVLGEYPNNEEALQLLGQAKNSLDIQKKVATFRQKIEIGQNALQQGKFQLAINSLSGITVDVNTPELATLKRQAEQLLQAAIEANWYEQTLKEGIQAMNQKNYDDAGNLFLSIATAESKEDFDKPLIERAKELLKQASDEANSIKKTAMKENPNVKPMDNSMLSSAKSGKILGIPFIIGSNYKNVIKAWGKPIQAGQYQGADYIDYDGVSFFYGINDRISSIEVNGHLIGKSPNDIINLLGKPNYDGDDADTIEGRIMIYFIGSYSVYFQYKDKNEVVDHLLYKITN